MLTLFLQLDRLESGNQRACISCVPRSETKKESDTYLLSMSRRPGRFRLVFNDSAAAPKFDSLLSAVWQPQMPEAPSRCLDGLETETYSLRYIDFGRDGTITKNRSIEERAGL